MLLSLAAYAHGAWRDQSYSLLCWKSLLSTCTICLPPLCAKHHTLITMVHVAVYALVTSSQNHDYQIQCRRQMTVWIDTDFDSLLCTFTACTAQELCQLKTGMSSSAQQPCTS